MNAQLQQELNTLIRNLQGLSPSMKGRGTKVLVEGAEIMRAAIARRTPQGKSPHTRYQTQKANKNIRAPKGQGQAVATYQPGNLKKSFSVLRFRRSKAVFIGPQIDKSAGGKMPDGYYAHMLEFSSKNVDGSLRPGKGFVAAAVAMVDNTVLRYVVEGLKGNIRKYVRSRGLSWGERYEAAKGR